ncbi:MAG: sodium-dependent transporter [Pontiellaceae bacterium]|nr:sodium-dependent transporter [Pontiellaceae bacterium]
MKSCTRAGSLVGSISMKQKKEAWGSRIGVILAVTGSAVGLGNFLRFPGKAAQYEGGAFMIPYFIALLLLGLPIAWTEWTMGRYGGARGHNSIPGIFRVVWRRKMSPYLGVLGLLIPVVIYMYYVYIEAWCLGYAFKFATGQMDLGPDKGAYADFFSRFIGLGADGAVFNFSNLSGLNSVLLFMFVCFVLNFVIIYRGLSKGIETFCKWARPALIVCALVVLVRVLTLGTPDPAHPDQNVLNGLGYMWNLGWGGKSLWQSLGNAQMWLEAAGQIFFTLSVGFGIISCYASYLKPDDDVALSSVTAAAGNEFCEVALGGLITIPAAFVFLGAVGVTEAAGSTFNLGFMTLPMVFNTMPFGQFVGTIFFFLLFLAALTSSISMLQPAIAMLEEGLGLGRRASVALLGFITASGTAFVIYFSKDALALDTFDFWVGSVCIYILATIEVILFGWVIGIERGYNEMMRGAEIRIPKIFLYIIKYVSPVYLLAVFAIWLYQSSGTYVKRLVTEPVVAMSVGFLVLVFIFFLIITAQSVRRWNKVHPLEKEPHA